MALFFCLQAVGLRNLVLFIHGVKTRKQKSVRASNHIKKKKNANWAGSVGAVSVVQFCVANSKWRPPGKNLNRRSAHTMIALTNDLLGYMDYWLYLDEVLAQGQGNSLVPWVGRD